MTAIWRVRLFEEPDLDRAVRLWERNSDEVLPIFPLASVVDAVRAGHAALVAEIGEEVVGAAVAEVDSDDAWLLRLTVLPDRRGQGIGGALLDALIARLEGAGVRRFISLTAAGETAGLADQTFVSRGFARRDEVSYFERRLGGRRDGPEQRLRQLGGFMVEPGLWQRLAGMEREKALIERRVILPLAEPALARHHGVEPPKAIILFGPPGTGKTTFAKGVASRLRWPFVELFPSALAADGLDGQLAALREFFIRVTALDEVVLFIDEVEDLAARRDGRSVTHAMTNELLKSIPRFREAGRHLLVCATNSIRRLDGAFIRAGRFDYLLPVGPPDDSARQAIWSSYVDRITDQPVDLGRLVAASKLFTPADIDFAARKAAQAAFERSVFEQDGTRATVDDFLAAVAATRPSLDGTTIGAFEEDIEAYARL